MIEKLADDWLDDLNDPFEKFIGSLSSDIPGWSDDHDKYIGEVLYNEMQDIKK